MDASRVELLAVAAREPDMRRLLMRMRYVRGELLHVPGTGLAELFAGIEGLLSREPSLALRASGAAPAVGTGASLELLGPLWALTVRCAPDAGMSLWDVDAFFCGLAPGRYGVAAYGFTDHDDECGMWCVHGTAHGRAFLDDADEVGWICLDDGEVLEYLAEASLMPGPGLIDNPHDLAFVLATNEWAAKRGVAL